MAVGVVMLGVAVGGCGQERVQGTQGIPSATSSSALVASQPAPAEQLFAAAQGRTVTAVRWDFPGRRGAVVVTDTTVSGPGQWTAVTAEEVTTGWRLLSRDGTEVGTLVVAPDRSAVRLTLAGRGEQQLSPVREGQYEQMLATLRWAASPTSR